ncbi:unnamed protein product [Ectocarpus sp. CCAP 1310/34]|nr:unnamed protein product [Ectocarpus sp. CCAP 1310/34]
MPEAAVKATTLGAAWNNRASDGYRWPCWGAC